MTRQLWLLFALTFSFISFAVSAETPTSAIATFAGGCFWTMQNDFDHVKGVIKTTAGYTGGRMPHPTYEEVETGVTGHMESVQVVYDPKVISYDKLLDVYWHNIDPSDADGQFCDEGRQYRSAIFFHDDEQKKIATSAKQSLSQSKRFGSIATQILPARAFYPAEDYHQEFAKRNPERYEAYRIGCGRDARLREIWGK